MFLKGAYGGMLVPSVTSGPSFAERAIKKRKGNAGILLLAPYVSNIYIQPLLLTCK